MMNLEALKLKKTLEIVRSSKDNKEVVLCCTDQEPGSAIVKEDAPIKFTLMTRRGNKQHFSSLDVPVSDQLAASYRQREEVKKALCSLCLRNIFCIVFPVSLPTC